MTQKLLFITAFVLFRSIAWGVADFSGHWVGPGKISSNVGLSANCSRIEIILHQSADKITIDKYQSTCDLFGSTWGPIEMPVQGGDVYEDGEKVGTISDDTLLTLQPDGDVSYAFNLKIKTAADGTTVLDTYYGTGNAIGAIATEGTLQKVP